MAILDSTWILGIGIMFGLAFIMSSLTFKDMDSFIIYLTIFSGFVVWGGLLPMWILVVCIIILTLMIISKTNIRGKM